MGKIALTGNSRTRKRLADLATAAAFAPTDIANLYAWYDASDTGTITDTSGNVDQWNDKSGNARHLTGSGATRPVTNSRTVNGLNVIDFQAADYLTRTTSISFTTATWSLALYVLNDSSAGNNSGLVVLHNGSGNDYDNANSFVLENSDASNYYAIVANSGNTFSQGGVGVIPTGTYVWRFDSGVSNGNREIRPDGTTTDSTRTVSGTAGGGILIGTRYISGAPDTHYYDGVMAEICLYNAAISNTDMTNLRNYLIAKWGS